MRREKELRRVVEYFGFADGTSVYTIIPNKIIGDYGYVGNVVRGKIDLSLNKWGAKYHDTRFDKGFIRAVCGFLSKKKDLVYDYQGNVYFIDGKPLMKDSNLFVLNNGQLYFVNRNGNGSNIHMNYYLNKNKSKEILDLFSKIKNRYYKEKLANDLDWLFYVMEY